MLPTGSVGGRHGERENLGPLHRLQPLQQVVLGERVHHEPDGAEVQPVNRGIGAHYPVQGLQHQPVATQSDDHIGGVERMVAIALAEPVGDGVRFRRAIRDETESPNCQDALRGSALPITLARLEPDSGAALAAACDAGTMIHVNHIGTAAATVQARRCAAEGKRLLRRRNPAASPRHTSSEGRA